MADGGFLGEEVCSSGSPSKVTVIDADGDDDLAHDDADDGIEATATSPSSCVTVKETCWLSSRPPFPKCSILNLLNVVCVNLLGVF